MNQVLADAPSTPSPFSKPGDPAWEVALLFPRQGEWTEEAYLALDTNRLVELSNGCLEVLPVPTIAHQWLAGVLFKRLDAFVSAQAMGHAFFAPLPVRLGSDHYREPDVVYLSTARLKRHKKYPQGADLVMEIVSPGDENRRRDLQIKRKEYAAAGIAEYWIVDPEAGTITVLALKGKTYRKHGSFGIGEIATSVLLPGFSVEVAPLFGAVEHLDE